MGSHLTSCFIDSSVSSPLTKTLKIPDFTAKISTNSFPFYSPKSHKASEKHEECPLKRSRSFSKENTRNSYNSLLPEENAINLKDFTIVREFDCDKVYKGKRYLVKKKNSLSLFSMTNCRKTLIESHKKELFSIQKQILEVNNPFLAKIQHLIENQSSLFIFQSYFSGLDLAFQVSQLGFFKEKIARFYLAEMILALGNLPKNQVLSQSLENYLDLKSMLLDRDGHLSVNLISPLLRNTKKMGSSLDERYNPPEFFMESQETEKNNDNSAALAWKLGVFLYEMLSGKKPFANSQEILENHLKFSHDFPENAVGLIRELLLTNPLLRLGNKGISELKNHEFFKGIHWLEMQEKRTIGPLALSSKMENKLFLDGKENFTEKFIEEKDEDLEDFEENDEETADEKTQSFLSNVYEEDEEVLME